MSIFVYLTNTNLINFISEREYFVSKNRNDKKENFYISSPSWTSPDCTGSSSESGCSEAINNIIETGSITVKKGDFVIHCLTVIGQIEGHYILPAQNKTTKYEHVIPQLVAIEESDGIDGLLLVLNTVGGDIEAGLAIAELISGMKTPSVSLVLGGGHSIGVPLAVSADKSFITPSATMTVHPVRMNGLVLGVPQTLSYFEQMQERIVRFVSDNSCISADRFRELMLATGELVLDVGTVLEGEKAVGEGLIDSIGSLSDAIECLCDMIKNKTD
ncbi:MAG: ATP-dependent Clp protease proteolytic subunit [Clostridia bacterium]|nr:ATP-dependent Clp protease proteolytic subunit [Clostridia bacterium]